MFINAQTQVSKGTGKNSQLPHRRLRVSGPRRAPAAPHPRPSPRQPAPNRRRDGARLAVGTAAAAASAAERTKHRNERWRRTFDAAVATAAAAAAAARTSLLWSSSSITTMTVSQTDFSVADETVDGEAGSSSVEEQIKGDKAYLPSSLGVGRANIFAPSLPPPLAYPFSLSLEGGGGRRLAACTLPSFLSSQFAGFTLRSTERGHQ